MPGAKIQYLKAYQGIQPGTVVAEHRPDVVKRLTKPYCINPEKNLWERVAKIVPDNTPTTAELEQQSLAAAREAEESDVQQQKAITESTENKAITGPGANETKVNPLIDPDEARRMGLIPPRDE